MLSWQRPIAPHCLILSLSPDRTPPPSHPIDLWVLSLFTNHLNLLSQRTIFWVLSHVANHIHERVEEHYAERDNGKKQRWQITLNPVLAAFVRPLP